MQAALDIRIHLPAHRERALSLQTEMKEAAEAYDSNIKAYVDFLREEATAAGYSLEADESEGETAITYHGNSESRQAAHDWLQTQPDLWNWIP